jgi:hypothetical protein
MSVLRAEKGGQKPRFLAAAQKALAHFEPQATFCN